MHFGFGVGRMADPFDEGKRWWPVGLVLRKRDRCRDEWVPGLENHCEWFLWNGV